MVVLDCGGADEAISDELLSLVAYLSPNETELARLTGAHPHVLPPAGTVDYVGGTELRRD